MLLTAVLEKLDWKEIGIQINIDYLNNFRFADYIILISKSTGDGFVVAQRKSDSGLKDEYEENQGDIQQFHTTS